MYISPRQRHAMNTIEQLKTEFNKEVFIQSEVPDVTLHTFNALVDKGFLDEIESKTTGLIYYKYIKSIKEWIANG